MPLPSQRYLALDVFRGMTVCFMIIVNTPGSYDTAYSPLLHATWHGFTPTDLVFPSFLFAVGNALAFVMAKWENLPQRVVLRKIFVRTAIIFILGFLMYWFPFVEHTGQKIAFKSFENTRIFGVLQRIALTYCIASLLIYYLKWRTALIITCAILLLYWPVMYFFGAPGDPYSLTGNAALRLDLWLVGPNHLYRGEGIAFDPEGLLSTFPAIGNVVGGYIAGRVIRLKGKSYETIAKLMLGGFLLIALAYFWHLGFPINKKLWTSSYVLYTVGLDCIILSLIIYVIDFLGKVRWTYFFEVFGKNALFIYLVSEVVAILLWFFGINSDSPYYSWLYQNIFRKAGPYFGSFLFALTFMMGCWFVGWIMDRKKIYIRV